MTLAITVYEPDQAWWMPLRRKGQIMDELAGGPVLDQGFARELVDRARSEGVNLVGPGGLLGGLTKQVLESALEAEMSEHLGYDANDPVGRNGENSRNGVRTKTVVTDIGPVSIDVPRDRDGRSRRSS